MSIIKSHILNEVILSDMFYRMEVNIRKKYMYNDCILICKYELLMYIDYILNHKYYIIMHCVSYLLIHMHNDCMLIPNVSRNLC